jgi:heme-degrading monooxygenase HmoA
MIASSTGGTTYLSAQGRSTHGFPQGRRMHMDTRLTPWIYRGREQDMYALIRQYEGLDATTRETATMKANEELRPILSKTPGFVSYELVKPDTTDGAVASISVFETRAHAEESAKVAEEWVRSNLPSMARPSKLAGELVAH